MITLPTEKHLSNSVHWHRKEKVNNFQNHLSKKYITPSTNTKLRKTISHMVNSHPLLDWSKNGRCLNSWMQHYNVSLLVVFSVQVNSTQVLALFRCMLHMYIHTNNSFWFWHEIFWKVKHLKKKKQRKGKKFHT